MAAGFQVTEPAELWALTRALLAAKFNDGSDPELCGSPYIADLCERAVEALLSSIEAGRFTAFHPSEGGRLRGRYFGPPADPTLEVVRREIGRAAARRGNWGGWSSQERADFVRLLLRPFRADDQLVAKLVEGAADSRTNQT